MRDRKAVDAPCRGCPFKRSSCPGWLGAASYEPEQFLAPHWYNVVALPCHMSVDWEAMDAQERATKAPLCRGFLVMAKNACKLPLSTVVADAMKVVERDTKRFFQSPHEFNEHHKRPEPKEANGGQG